jgi:membrane protein implicated in regulation of membrane protease activity
VLILSAPVLRYLLGMTLLGTGGSVLAVAILHASFNASGGLASVHGWWPSYVAMLALFALMVAVRRVAPSRLRPQARLEERGYASAGSVSTLTR